MDRKKSQRKGGSRGKGIAAAMILLGGLLGVGALVFGVRASTPEIRDSAGEVVPGSIAELRKIELGEMEQWITIRGRDASNPILLWLHGGPGGAQMPFAHYLDGALEEYFVVVQWDQRGAGKSNHGGFDEETMELERYVQDALELISYLRVRFGEEGILLLGHSWGTQIGMEVAVRHPEFVDAYIGVGQVVHIERATVIARDWLLERIDSEENRADWVEVQTIEVPTLEHREFRRLNRLVDAYGGSLDLSIGEMAKIALGAKEYHGLDYLRLVRGFFRGGGPMHREGMMEPYDLFDEIPALEMPVTFISGAKDYNTPVELIREYYEVLEAPQKELIVFEEAAHQPFFADPERFSEAVIRAERR